MESPKKQRIERVAEQDEMAIRVVKVSGEEEFHTMDDYESDLQMDDQDERDAWEGEETVSTTAMPQELWSSHDASQQPPEPTAEIDRLADQVELQRLLSMGVLVKDVTMTKRSQTS